MASSYTSFNGGRVLLLLLLFLLALYELATVGFSIFAIVCLSPLIIVAIYTVFKWRMAAFWALIVINYFLQM